MSGPTLFFGRMSPREVLDALGADLVARGALHPTQLQSAAALVDAGRVPATALIDVGAPAISVLAALSICTGLPMAVPRSNWSLTTRLSLPPATWTALLAVPIGTDAVGRPVIAFADPSKQGASLALTLPPHGAVVALEADVRDALAVTPAAAPRSAVSFLAPPSAVAVTSSSSASPAFADATRPALAGTMVGAAPPITSSSPSPSPPPPSMAPPTLAPPTMAPPTMAPPVMAPTAAPAPVTMMGVKVSPAPSWSSSSSQPSSPFAMTPPASSTAIGFAPTSASPLSQVTSAPPPQPTGGNTQVMASGGFAAEPLAGSSSSPTFGPTVGGRCGPFRLERRLGEGGMATVFLGVTDDGSKPKAAIKIVHEHLLRSTAGEELRRRFQREATAMKQLQHKNVVGFVDAGAVGETEYLATEFISGGTLSDLLRKTGKLPPLLAVSVMADVLRGLEHAHARGVVHRDLKPENLLIDSSDSDAPLKIADFGIARIAEGTKLTGTNRIIGTPAYMSPEQASAGAIDTRTDLYTTGVILYELITGKNPFTGETPMATLGHVMAGNVRPVGDVEPSVPFVVDVVVARLLSLRADDRYATAQDVLAALAPVLERGRAMRAHWSHIVGGAPGAVAGAVAAEAVAWAAAARAELAHADRAAAAGFSAFRAVSLDPDQRDAKGVLSALESRGLRFKFTRSIDPTRIKQEHKVEVVPVDERRELYRALGDAYFAEDNPRFASQWWRRAVKAYGADEADFARLARVTAAAEMNEVETLDARAEAHRSQRPTQNGWRPASQQHQQQQPETQTAPATTTPTTTPTKSLPKWAVPLLIVIAVLLAFAAGQLTGAK